MICGLCFSGCSSCWRALQLNRKIHRNTIMYLSFQPHLLFSIPPFQNTQTSITPHAYRSKIRRVVGECLIKFTRSEEDVALFDAPCVEKKYDPISFSMVGSQHSPSLWRAMDEPDYFIRAFSLPSFPLWDSWWPPWCHRKINGSMAFMGMSCAGMAL